MFIKVSDNDINKIKDIGCAGFSIICVLRTYSNYKTNKPVFPSYETIAERLGISRKTVQRTIKSLCNSGNIVIEYRKGKSSLFVLPDINNNNKHELLPGSNCPDTKAKLTQGEGQIVLTPGSNCPDTKAKLTHEPRTTYLDIVERTNLDKKCFFDSVRFLEFCNSFRLEPQRLKTAIGKNLVTNKQFDTIEKVLKSSNVKNIYGWIKKALENGWQFDHIDIAVKKIKNKKEISKMTVKQVKEQNDKTFDLYKKAKIYLASNNAEALNYITSNIIIPEDIKSLGEKSIYYEHYYDAIIEMQCFDYCKENNIDFCNT